MNKLSHILKAGLLAGAFLLTMPTDAQTVLPENALPMIVAPHTQTISSRERALYYNITANVPYEVTTNADWVKVRKKEDGSVFIYVQQNYYNEPRTAAITFANAEKGITQTFNLTQDKDQSVNDLPTDIQIKPFRAEDNTHQDSGSSIAASIDGDYGTIYHSKWSTAVTPENPAILTYEFKDVDHLDYINYVPRSSGSNGNFGQFELYIKQGDDTEYKLYGTYDWKGSGNVRTISFAEPLQNPTAIQFKVLTGAGNYASCAEMQFCVKATGSEDFSIFADDVMSELKEGITEEDIDNLSNPFAKSLAYQLYEKTYSKEYRVAEYECFLSYVTLSEMWNAPGKYYDQIAGVTGINIPAKSKTAVVVSGIPDDINVQLKVVAWYVGKIGGNFDGGDPHTTTYSLRNGINVIDYTYDWDGLAYICYYADEHPEKYAPIKVHFVNGQVNGYLSPDKTNEEMHEICRNAKNRCMDLYSKKAHQIWESEGLYKYCKSTTGSIGYRQFMNVIDSLVTWEHRSLGFEKYNRVPTNRTMAYVNYTYYMFQGGFGVSFHMDQQSRVLNCNNIVYSDNDAIWGLSHEWGHQHQMHPHFCWSGMSEVSNNLQSYYNIMKMGFRTSDKINQWPSARQHFLDDKDYSSGTRTSDQRKNAYNNRSYFSYSPKMYQLCEEMQGGVISPIATNKVRGVAYAEVGVGETLCPLIMLHNYFTTNGFPDFMPDWYEALRQSDDENGSQIEKQGEVDKYELIASAQNGNKNGKLAVLREKYPESCWVKDGYITEEHCNMNDNAVPFIMNFCRKTSRLVGYNLFPYFEQWGYLRQVALEIGDYGTKRYVMTEDMYNEFKQDMDALVESGELKEMPADMVKNISNSKDWFQSTPNFPN